MRIIIIFLLWLMTINLSGQGVINNDAFLFGTTGSYIVFSGDHSQKIQSYTPGNTSLYNMTININGDSCKLVLDDQSFLTVNGALVMNDTFLLRSSASGTSSLITYGSISDAKAKAEGYIPTDDTYHFISSPVAYAMSGVFHYAWLYRWNEPEQNWFNIIPLGVRLMPMTGYSVVLRNAGGNPPEMPDNPTLYRGMPNTGEQGTDHNLTNTDGADASLEGYNLVGNPYPSAIDWDAAEGWTKTDVDDAIYYWKDIQYASYVNGVGVNGGTNIIPSRQGFFVRRDHSTFGTGTLKMDNRVRVHNGSSMNKSNACNVLRLKVEGNGYTDESVIRFSNIASNDFDSHSDAYKMFGYKEVPQIFTRISDSSSLSINTLYAMDDSIAIPLLLRTGANANYTIVASEISSFEQGTHIYLDDHKQNISVLLNTNPVYNFYSDTSDAQHRFTVRFFNVANQININSQEEVQLFNSGGKIYINLIDVNCKDVVVCIYNSLGQEVYKSKLNPGQLNVLSVNFTEGCYINRLIVGEKQVVKKLYIN